MLLNLKISSKLNLNQNKIQEIGTDHLGLVLSVIALILNPAYGRHRISRLMRIEAPIPKKSTKVYIFCFFFQFMHLFFGKFCYCMPTLGICSSTRSLHDTRKWVFCAYAQREGGLTNERPGSGHVI